jgi:uncharacterized protein (TIGR02217 family)
MSIVIDEIRLPEDVERRARFITSWSTVLSESDSGRERAVKTQVHTRGRAVVAYGHMTDAMYLIVKSFFNGRNGRARGFLFKDWSDYFVSRQVFGVGDTVETDFPLFNTYPDAVNPYSRRIWRPVESTLRIWVNNVEVFSPGTWTLVKPGLIRFGVAPAAVNIEAEYDFDIPVRFDTDDLDTEVEIDGVQKVPGLDIREVKEEEPV